MAGLFPGICNAQNVDLNGQPLESATLTVYVGGTLTLASCFQDIGLAIPAQNPMQADITGRLPFFYVGDGVYSIRLIDQYGVQVYYYPQVASIGASSSGGGGTAVDPTTIFQTGDLIWLDASGVRTGWVRDNALTIGSATSGASERANTDCKPLFLFGWAAGWVVVGGSGANALADWNANKQITLPDKRGAGPRGLDDMGNVAAGEFAGVPFISGTATTAGALCGENVHTLVLGETPSFDYTPAGSIDVSGGSEVPNGAGNFNGANGAVGDATANTGGFPDVTAAFNGNLAVLGGSNGPHNNVSGDVLGTFYRKL